MSVSFVPEFVDGDQLITCSCGDVASETIYSTRALAYAALISLTDEQRPRCGDELCGAYYPKLQELVEAPYVNISNENAKEILSMLGLMSEFGFSDSCAGSIAADDFLGRILLAEAIVPEDAGVPAHELSNGGDTLTMVNCGRAPGYFQEVLARLKDLVSYAQERELKLTWG